MGKYLFIVILFCSSSVISQAVAQKSKRRDSVKVFYESNLEAEKFKVPFYYLDGKAIGKNQLYGIDLKDILDLQVKQNATGNGEVRMRSKIAGQMNTLVLLAAEIEQYVGKSDLPTIYMIDDVFIKDDIYTYKFQRDYILSIKVMTSDNFASLKNMGVKLRVINVITKSQKNIEEANKIYIRGNVNQKQNSIVKE